MAECKFYMRDNKLITLPSANIIRNSGFEDSTDNLPDYFDLNNTPTLAIATDTLFPSRGGNQITIIATGQIYEGIKITGGTDSWLKALPDETYTFSFDYKVNAGDAMKVDVSSYNDAAQGTRHINTSPDSTTPVRQSYTLTTDADANNLSINLFAKADGDTVIVSHPQLELGSSATDYSESGSDIPVSGTRSYMINNNYADIVISGVTYHVSPFNMTISEINTEQVITIEVE